MATFVQRCGSWRCRVRMRGELLTRTFDTREQAEAWAAKEEARIANPPDPKPLAPLPASPTVKELFARYAQTVSPSKRGERWEVIRLAMLGKQFDMLATALDGASLAAWRDGRLKRVSPSTVNRELNLISAVYTRAIKEWRLPLPISPVRTIMRPAMPKARRRRVSDAERAAIMKQLDWDGISPPQTIKQQVAWVFSVSLETMMRQGEVIGITWQHVHTDKRYVHLPATKNGEYRDVPLSSRAVALFNLLPRGVDGQRVVAINQGTLGGYFRKATKAAGVTDLHFHDSRREALTRISKKLTNVVELARASGHSNTRSLMIYYRPDAEDLADKLD